MPLEEPIHHALSRHAAGDLAGAEKISRQILAATPNHPPALALLGLIAHQVGQHHPAVDLITRAIAIDPNIPAFHTNLAAALNALGRFDDAIAASQSALRLRPDDPIALLNLGNAQMGRRDLDDAVATYRTAIARQPRLIQAHNNLGHALRTQRRFDEAIEAFRATLAIAPNLAEAHANLANTFKDQAKLDEAIDSFRAAVHLAPTNASLGSNLIYARCFDPRATPQQLFDEHRAWAEQHAEMLRDPRPHTNDCNPNRRLRIGYVSANFRNQVLGLYIEPLLAAHDRTQFEIFSYSDVITPDEVTARIKSYGDGWRDIAGVTDAQLAGQIRDDRIDILVDMSNHMGDNRLLTFAAKPAPVQITFPHPFTTGMSAMDYVITDPHLDPPGMTEHLHSEKLLRLPETYLCYPASESIDVQPPPSSQGRPITFITVNNFCKINPGVLRTWAAIMSQLPDSRLLVRLDGGVAGTASAPQWFADYRIDSSRVEFIDALARSDYLRLFHRADICLDPFPYAGYTTSLDALWMGVPLVTLAGETSLSRFGVSILSNLGLPELIAHAPEQYITIALDLARDQSRLIDLRHNMRERFERSPLVDHQRFAHHVEAAYRTAWQTWAV